MKAKILLFVLLITIGAGAKAQVGAVVAAVGGDFVVKDVLNKFRQDAELLLARPIIMGTPWSRGWQTK
ncbi:MAG TPA: hypothetical protein VHE34_09955 [Puia sp.]|nr:hypothetical protein [Puia sp.]